MSGADHPNNDFGNFKQGTKSGLKYNDLNADGDRDAGQPVLLAGISAPTATPTTTTSLTSASRS